MREQEAAFRRLLFSFCRIFLRPIDGIYLFYIIKRPFRDNYVHYNRTAGSTAAVSNMHNMRDRIY